jgi:hypothetical protein
MILPYLLAFCRVVIGLVFGFSSLSKVINFSIFEQTIIQFDLFPKGLSPFAALFFLSSEFIIALLMIVGNSWLAPGFFLGTFLLMLFCGGLISAMHRNIRIACNCFGPFQGVISMISIYRNIVFLICAIIGFTISVNGETWFLGPVDWILSGLGAVALVIICMHLDEIVQVFRQE